MNKLIDKKYQLKNMTAKNANTNITMKDIFG
jgi:hypothetical protein